MVRMICNRYAMWTRSNKTKTEKRKTDGSDYPMILEPDNPVGRIIRYYGGRIIRSRKLDEKFWTNLDNYDSTCRSDKETRPATKNLKKMQSRLWQTLTLTFFGAFSGWDQKQNEIYGWICGCLPRKRWNLIPR